MRLHLYSFYKQSLFQKNISWNLSAESIIISSRTVDSTEKLMFSRNVCLSMCNNEKSTFRSDHWKIFRETVEDGERKLCNFQTFTKLPWKQLLYKKSQFDFVFSSKFLREIKCVCLQYWNELPSFTKFYLK